MDRLTPVQLLTVAREAGFTVQADQGQLHLTGPKAADALAQRLIGRKADLLQVLCGGTEASPQPDEAEAATTRQQDAETAQTARTAQPQPEPAYTPCEQAVLKDAGVEPSSMPLLDEVKRTWPDSEVLGVEPDPPPQPLPANPRAEAEQVALAEIAGTQPPADPDAMTPAERQQWIRDTAAGSRWHEAQCAGLPV